MSYWLTRFGSKNLPRCNAIQDNGMQDIAIAYAQYPYGGVFDAYGSAQGRIALPTAIAVEGTLYKKSQQATELYAWRALQGVRDILYRRRDDGAYDESITARLTRFTTTRSYANPDVLELQFQFDGLEEVWAGLSHTETVTLDASPKSGDLTNDGNAIQRDIVITVTAGGSPITLLEVGVAGISLWKWTGSIAVGQSLVIDCARQTIYNNGADAYAGFELTVLHTIPEWLRLPAGTTTVQTWRTGGDNTSTITFAYKDAWA